MSSEATDEGEEEQRRIGRQRNVGGEEDTIVFVLPIMFPGLWLVT